jgi:hypothetical protein
LARNYLERMQERWVCLWTKGKVVRNYLERMKEEWVGLWTKGKVVRNYLKRMQERWVGLWTQVEGGEELPGEATWLQHLSGSL